MGVKAWGTRTRTGAREVLLVGLCAALALVCVLLAGSTAYAEEGEECSHSYEAVVTDPTCTEQGYTTYTCSLCGDTYVSNYVAATGHSYESEVTEAATCTEQGLLTYTCTVCGQTYSEVIEATGHVAADEAELDVVTEGDCTTDGLAYSRVLCTVCGAEISSETIVIEATGHSWYGAYVDISEDGTEGVVWLYCSVCGEDLSYDAETFEAVDNGDGTVTYTATVTYKDVEYTATTTYVSAVTEESDTSDSDSADSDTSDSDTSDSGSDTSDSDSADSDSDDSDSDDSDDSDSDSDSDSDASDSGSDASGQQSQGQQGQGAFAQTGDTAPALVASLGLAALAALAAVLLAARRRAA